MDPDLRYLLMRRRQEEARAEAAAYFIGMVLAGVGYGLYQLVSYLW